MRICKAEIFTYCIPLRRPLTSFPSSTERRGLLLLLTDDKKNKSWGEIAPLPGLHRETFVQAQENLFSVLEILKSSHFWQRKADDDVFMPEELHDVDLLPSVRFGIEMAIWGWPESLAFFKPMTTKVKVNGLLSGTSEEIRAKAKTLKRQGYDVLKLKVGRKDIDSDIALLQQLRALGDHIKLRLDANRSWDFEQALYFAAKVAGLNIDYIEEPLRDIHRLDEFYAATGIPFAIDESLVDLTTFPKMTKALVLKPSFIGGIEKTICLIRQGEQQNIQPVISSAFETGLGLTTLARLAGMIPGNAAMGLDTWRWLRHDLIKPRFRARNGTVSIVSGPHPFQVNHAFFTII